jgi:hypothetical protein
MSCSAQYYYAHCFLKKKNFSQEHRPASLGTQPLEQRYDMKSGALTAYQPILSGRGLPEVCAADVPPATKWATEL